MFPGVTGHVNTATPTTGIDELLAEKEKYKGISEELDQTFAELAGF